jgi:broad specificity phosphatase PhoE
MDVQGQRLVYLVRHAEPAMPDAVPRFIGARSNPPLSLGGITQAQRLARRLGHVDFAGVWSSGLARSLQTAEIVSGLPSASIRIEPRLKEVDLGLWDGLSTSEIRRRFPQEWIDRESDIIGFRFPGGESFLDLQRRAIGVMRDLPAVLVALPPGAILLVAHKSFNRALLCHLLGTPLEGMFDISQDHCCVNVLRLETTDAGLPRFRVVEIAS